MTKRMLIMIGGVLVLVAVLALGFFLHIRSIIANSPKPGPQTVSTIKAQVLEWQPQIPSVGTLVAVRGVDVTTEIAGLVRSVNFKSGQDVKAGELLVQLNADSDVAQLNSLQAAAELSAVTLKRDQAQLAGQAVSQALVDNDLADLKSRRALVAQQQALVAKKTIRAPFAGRLGITTVNPGQYLNPGDTIVTLQTIDPIYANFSAPQKQIASLSVGQVVNVATDAFAGELFPGKINAISPKVDPSTRNVSLQATIANPQRRLLPGMFARANVDVGQKQRYLTLPQTAITYNPYGATVFILKPAEAQPAPGGKDEKNAKPAAPAAPAGSLVAQQVFVTTGETRGDQVAILKGVVEGQEVVTSGQLKLKNGTPVVVDNRVQPANSANPTPQEK
ncbi:efflux RND transporter periplasmic adaptor subunit [Polaromonas sp. UC242_47]|uniref:efflux RND transporter periplasmic adaptor subunit n=1 Tax=Polaromonas sp. UC242_47 TaxID=3374626 RepID=UPI0037A7D8B7